VEISFITALRPLRRPLRLGDVATFVSFLTRAKGLAPGGLAEFLARWFQAEGAEGDGCNTGGVRKRSQNTEPLLFRVKILKYAQRQELASPVVSTDTISAP